MPIVLLDERDKAEIQGQIDTAAAKAAVKSNILEKRITNLEQGITPSPFVTDSTVAYQKEVPTNALPYAEVGKVGGMTRKCANLIPYPYVDGSITLNGIEWTVIADGTITANGTATENSFYPVMYAKDFQNGKYHFKCLITASNGAYSYVICNNGAYFYDYGGGISFDVTSSQIQYIGLCVESGVTVSNLVFKPMLNEGSTALPYEPYFEGLRSAPVTEVESVGANLLQQGFWNTWQCDASVASDGKITFTRNASGGTSFVDAAYVYLMVGETYYLSVSCANVELLQLFDSASNFIFNFYGGGASFTPTNSGLYFIRVQMAYNLTTIGDVAEVYLWINKGNALPYSHYVRNTLPIPEAVKALDGYGWGINESVYNYIDWEKKQFVKRVEKIVLDGSSDEDWKVQQYSNLTAYLDDNRFGLIPHGTPNHIVCDSFKVLPIISSQPNGTVGVSVEGLNNFADSFFFGISGIASNANEWISYLAENPVTIIYELSNPIITDISDILSDDNFIGVEGNGTITMVNEHKFAVPSSITYQVKGDA